MSIAHGGTARTVARSLTVILTAVLLGPMLSPVAGGPGAAALASPALPGPAETVLPPDTVGYLPWHFYLEGTVDLASGNLYFTAEDASVASIGEDALEHQVIASSDPQPHPTRDLLLRRAYNSGMASVDSPFGFGWSHSYGGVLSPSTLPELSDDMIYQDESGAIHLFLATADGFTSPPGNYARLQAILDGWELLSKDGVVRRFDAGGKLVSVLDASKNELTIEYAAGRIHRVTGFHGISLRFEANADGRVQRVTDDLGRRWDYEYDASGNLIRVIDPLGFERLYRYDAAHLLTDAIDRAGIGLRVTYGGGIVREFGTFLHRYGPDTDTLVLRTHTLMYAPEHVVVHGPRGGKTMVQMDGSGAPVKVVDALGGTTRYAYDADHNPVRFQDARGSITLYEYDARGNNVRVVDPLGSVLTRTWENIDLPDRFQSLLTSFTNRRGFTGSLRYDSFGRTTELVTPGGSVTYTYDAEGSPGSVTNTRGNRRCFLFGGHQDVTGAYRRDGRQHFVIRGLDGFLTHRFGLLGQPSLDGREHHLLESNVADGLFGDPVTLQVLVDRALRFDAGYELFVLGIGCGRVLDDGELCGGRLADGFLDDQLEKVLVELITTGSAGVRSDLLDFGQRDGRPVDRSHDRSAAGAGCRRQCQYKEQDNEFAHGIHLLQRILETDVMVGRRPGNQEVGRWEVGSGKWEVGSLDFGFLDL